MGNAPDDALTFPPAIPIAQLEAKARRTRRAERRIVRPLTAKEREQIVLALVEGRAFTVTQLSEVTGTWSIKIRRGIAADPALAALLREAQERLVDKAEAALMQLVEKGNVQAILYVLSALGAARGWRMPAREITATAAAKHARGAQAGVVLRLAWTDPALTAANVPEGTAFPLEPDSEYDGD